MIESIAALPPPLVIQHRGEHLDHQTRIDEIHAWGTGVVAVRHGLDFPLRAILNPAVENGMLVSALAAQPGAARLLYKSEGTIKRHVDSAYRALRVSSSRAAIRTLFDPLVGGLEVVEPVELEDGPSPQLVEFLQILARGGSSYHADRINSTYWTKEKDYTHELTRLKTELGVSTSAAVLFWGFATNILGPDSLLLRKRSGVGQEARPYSLEGPSLVIRKWSPPPRPETPPRMCARHARGFSITHSEARDGSTLHFPHDTVVPLDAALVFRGHNLHIGRISGVELLGGRVNINRSHELASELSESNLRHLGAACLGFNESQSASTFYEPGDGPRPHEVLREVLGVPTGKNGKDRLRLIVDRAFQIKLLEVGVPLDFDIHLLPGYFSELVRQAATKPKRGEIASAMETTSSAVSQMMRMICAQLQVANMGGVITIARLRGTLQ